MRRTKFPYGAKPFTEWFCKKRVALAGKQESKLNIVRRSERGPQAAFRSATAAKRRLLAWRSGFPVQQRVKFLDTLLDGRIRVRLFFHLSS